MGNSIAIICCIEQGGLEYKGICMLLSLRRHWGRWKDIPIYAYSPRKENRISGWLRDVYAEYSITLVDEVLNDRYTDYPLANKPLCMAHAETNLSEDILVFLDSDMFCWNEPELFVLPRQMDLAMVADGTKTVASAGPDDSVHEPMWQQLYGITGGRGDWYNNTLMTDQVVRGWWSSGVIACRRSAGLMQAWLEVFEEALEKVSFTPSAHYLREQMTICAVAVAAAESGRFVELPVAYNYPVQNYSHYTSRGTSPDEAILWHYQPYMNKTFKMFRKKMDRVSTLAEKIRVAEEFIERVRVRYSKVIGTTLSRIKRTPAPR